MTVQHTPGPWHWDGNTLMPVNPDPSKSHVHTILDADGGYGFLGSANAKTLAELDADRALLAAAPDLLEALQQLLHATHAQCVTLQHRADAQRAIAKATGVQS